MREMDKILNNSKLPEPTKVQSKVFISECSELNEKLLKVYNFKYFLHTGVSLVCTRTRTIGGKPHGGL